MEDIENINSKLNRLKEEVEKLKKSNKLKKEYSLLRQEKKKLIYPLKYPKMYAFKKFMFSVPNAISNGVGKMQKINRDRIEKKKLEEF